jgi:N-acetyl-gamma-glutamyl-phosphate/LysW-gamma-L-alpha-aminoadipyl-6-phosphate reductase
MSIKVGVVGGSGYTGGELLRILSFHPGVEIVGVTSRKFKGEPVHRAHPNLRGLVTLKFTETLEPVASALDWVFIALPHGESMKVTPRFTASGIGVVDLSADFRLKSAESYKTWYGREHMQPDLLDRAVYGLPELYGNELKRARLIAAPGCNPSAALLSLAPAVSNRLIENGPVTVTALVGSSGAGRSSSVTSSHAERTGVMRAYSVANHRHTAEIEQELSRLAGSSMSVAFTPVSVNNIRGILTLSHAGGRARVEELWKAYREFYRGRKFVRIVRDQAGELQRYPDPKFTLGSNFADVGFESDARLSRLVFFGALDNLVKGAAGQAVQAFNIAAGLDESTGLLQPPLHPA